MRWLDSLMDMNFPKCWETVEERSLVSCGPWGRKESDVTQHLNDSKKFRGHSFLLIQRITQKRILCKNVILSQLTLIPSSASKWRCTGVRWIFTFEAPEGQWVLIQRKALDDIEHCISVINSGGAFLTMLLYQLMA